MPLDHPRQVQPPSITAFHGAWKQDDLHLIEGPRDPADVMPRKPVEFGGLSPAEALARELPCAAETRILLLFPTPLLLKGLPRQ